MLSFCWWLWPVPGVAAPLRGQRSRFGDLSSGLEDLSGNEPSVCHWGGVLCYPAGVIQDLWRGWGLGRPHVAWQSWSSVVGLRLGSSHAADAGEAFLSWISLEEGWRGLGGRAGSEPTLVWQGQWFSFVLCVHAKLSQSPRLVFILLCPAIPVLGSYWQQLTLSTGFPGSVVKNSPAMQETQVRSLDQEDTPEKEMATHSSVLARKITWTEEPGGLQLMSLQMSWTRLSDWTTTTTPSTTNSVFKAVHCWWIGKQS